MAKGQTHVDGVTCAGKVIPHVYHTTVLVVHTGVNNHRCLERDTSIIAPRLQIGAGGHKFSVKDGFKSGR